MSANMVETHPHTGMKLFSKNNGKHVFKHDPNMPLKIEWTFIQNKQEMFRNYVIMF